MNRGMMRGIESRLRRFEGRIQREGWESEVLAKRLEAGPRRLEARREKYSLPPLPSAIAGASGLASGQECD